MKQKTNQKAYTKKLHNKPGDIDLCRQVKKNKTARLYYLVPYIIIGLCDSQFSCVKIKSHDNIFHN